MIIMMSDSECVVTFKEYAAANVANWSESMVLAGAKLRMAT
jgi:hypothetical protein